MNIIKFSVSGKSLNDLPSKLNKVLSERYRDLYFREIGFAHIFAINEYYFRINSTLVTVVTLDASQENKCEIEVVSGGGSDGLLGFTWGAEGKSSKKVLDLIHELCVENSLEIK